MAHWPDLVSPDFEGLLDRIRETAFDLHRQVGPGYREATYQALFAHGLRLHGLAFQERYEFSVEYRGLRIERAREVDFLVEDSVPVEIKAVETLLPVHRHQIVSYLRASGKPVGALINFNAARMKDGWHRFVHPDLLQRDSEIRRFASSNAGGEAPSSDD